MENIKLSTPQIQDLKTHKNCELQLRESPFKDRSLMLYCLDHEEYLLGLDICRDMTEEEVEIEAALKSTHFTLTKRKECNGLCPCCGGGHK